MFIIVSFWNEVLHGTLWWFMALSPLICSIIFYSPFISMLELYGLYVLLFNSLLPSYFPHLGLDISWDPHVIKLCLEEPLTLSMFYYWYLYPLPVGGCQGLGYWCNRRFFYQSRRNYQAKMIQKDLKHQVYLLYGFSESECITDRWPYGYYGHCDGSLRVKPWVPWSKFRFTMVNNCFIRPLGERSRE